MDNILRFLICPFRMMNHIRQYFEIIRVIDAKRSGRLVSDSEDQLNRIVTRRLRIANLTIVFSALHFIRCYLYPPTNDLWAALNADFLYTLNEYTWRYIYQNIYQYRDMCFQA